MRRHATYVHGCQVVVRRPAAEPAPLDGIDPRQQARIDATELARDAAAVALLTASCEPDANTAVYHVTEDPPDGDNAADDLAALLKLRAEETPLVTMLDSSPGVINAIAAAARTLASTADGMPAVALVTASDAHLPGVVDDHGAPHVDTAGALVLSRRRGRLRLVSTVKRTDFDLQHQLRIGTAPDAVRAREVALVQATIRQAIEDASSVSAITAKDVAYMIAPPSPDNIERKAFRRLGGHKSAVVAAPEHGDTAGYLGSADLIVRLAPFMEPDRKLPRDAWILLVAMGGGCSAAVALFQVA